MNRLWCAVVILALGSGCASTKGWTEDTIFKQGAFRRIGDSYHCVLYQLTPNHTTWLFFEVTDTWHTDKIIFTVRKVEDSYKLGWLEHERSSAGVGCQKFEVIERKLVRCEESGGFLKGRIEGKAKRALLPDAAALLYFLEFRLREDPAEFDRLEKKDLSEHDPG